MILTLTHKGPVVVPFWKCYPRHEIANYFRITCLHQVKKKCMVEELQGWLLLITFEFFSFLSFLIKNGLWPYPAACVAFKKWTWKIWKPFSRLVWHSNVLYIQYLYKNTCAGKSFPCILITSPSITVTSPFFCLFLFSNYKLQPRSQSAVIALWFDLDNLNCVGLEWSK